MDNEPNYDIRALDVLDNLNSDFKSLINEKFKSFIEVLQENKSDILFLGEILLSKYQREIRKFLDTYRY